MTVAIFYYLQGEQTLAREVPNADSDVLPNVRWGRPEALFTPSYWMTQYWMSEEGLPSRCHKLGENLEEEVVACVLGGYGVSAEVGLAAFDRLRSRGLIGGFCADVSVVRENLREPLFVSGRRVTYRFWSQKAHYVAAALKTLKERPAPVDSPLKLRDYLMQIRGIGPKIASWIVRNWLNSNDVAILDIHVVRACQLMHVFAISDCVERHYFRMERRFLDFALAISVPASDLDSLIWSRMRSTPQLVSRALNECKTAPQKSRRWILSSDPSKTDCSSSKGNIANKLV